MLGRIDCWDQPHSYYYLVYILQYIGIRWYARTRIITCPTYLPDRTVFMTGFGLPDNRMYNHDPTREHVFQHDLQHHHY